MELPPNVLGAADDAWFRYVTDTGFLGPDKGKGGKFLFLPPGYKGDVPDGYFVVKSPTYGLWVPLRNFAVDGDVKPALESLRKHIRIYPLSEAGKEHGAKCRTRTAACCRSTPSRPTLTFIGNT
jgi:hypothetical protein